MNESQMREKVERAVAEELSRRRSRPPTPLYQKVVVSVMALGALLALIAVLFFR
jgi:hypothetical protein